MFRDSKWFTYLLTTSVTSCFSIPESRCNLSLVPPVRFSVIEQIFVHRRSIVPLSRNRDGFFFSSTLEEEILAKTPVPMGPEELQMRDH